MAASVALGVTLALFYGLPLQTVSRAQQLADGSWLKIRDVVVAEEYGCLLSPIAHRSVLGKITKP
jgi:hypothetical protein